MEKETSQRVRLGVFVLAGTAFLIASLYLIGTKRNLFNKTFSVHARFYNVNGLISGNNVRFSGIDVGTVQSVDMASGNMVQVTMIIDEKYKAFIHKNDLATIGTDGLMGNKLVNISVSGTGALIRDNDTLATVKPVETDEMMRTLNVTNDNIRVITDNLKNITQKINNSNSLWGLLADTTVAENVRQAIVSIRMTSERSAIITGDLSAITGEIRAGKGPVGMLLSDTTVSGRIRQSVVSFEMASNQVALVTGDLRQFTGELKSGKGPMATLLNDTILSGNLQQSVYNLKSGTAGFDENMQALKHSFLLRAYFRKQEKKK